VRILLVDPAADWSTRDVYVGLRDGLKECGHEVIEFRSGRLLSVFARALMLEWRRQKATTPAKPTLADAAYLMSERAVTWALRHEPDWIVIISGMYFHGDALVLMDRAGLKNKAILLTESPYDFDREVRMARLCDVVWTIERTAVPALEACGVPARYLPHAWHPGIHQAAAPTASGAPAHDVLFVGTGFRERADLLRAVNWGGLGADLALYGSWPLVKRRDLLRPRVRGAIIPNADAAELYRRAAINLNLFRRSMGFGKAAPQIHGAESLGPRAYELAALGAFFLSEWRAEVAERFGDLVPTFESAAELEELVRRWLPDASGRRERAAALPAAVRGHTWVERAEQVVSDLRRAGDAGLGPRSARDAPASATGEPPRRGRLELV
jgi:hypothetical protein